MRRLVLLALLPFLLFNGCDFPRSNEMASFAYSKQKMDSIHAQAEQYTAEKSAAGTRYIDNVFTSYNTLQGEYEKGFHFIMLSPGGDTFLKRPVIIVLHAGGGKIEDVKGWCEDWTYKGYVSITAEYKNDTGEFTAEKQKIATVQMFKLLDYLRINADKYGIKIKKVFIMGVSAGAITAIQTGIGLDDRFTSFYAGLPVPVNQKLNVAATATLSGTANTAFNNLITSADPPNFFYHGALDQTIPYSAALTTFNLEISRGIASTFMGFPDKGHKLESHDIILSDLTLKFYNVLKPNGISAN